MTDYGQNPGSQPWQPDDSLYGGQQDWSGGQPGTGHHHYGGQQPQQHYQHQAQSSWDSGQTPQYPGGWDTTGGGMPLADPYAAPAPQPDYYGTPDAYPPPNPHPRRPEPHQQPGQQPPHQQQPPRRPQPGQPAPGGRPGGREDWDPASRRPERDDHPFFDDGASGDDDFDDPRDGRRGGGRSAGRGTGRDRRGAKRRNGCACLVVALVLAAGLGGLGYVGYNFWSDRFGSAPDYAGEGHGNVTVEIPEGASVTQMGNILKEKGVVKSVQAFIDAAGDEMLHPGSYTLHKGMSGEAAVEMMVDPAALNAIVIPEGWRSSQAYEKLDEQLDLKQGTTAAAAKKHQQNLGLPEWAAAGSEIKDPLDGFIFPARYDAPKGTKPEVVLKRMVQRAVSEYEKVDLEGISGRLGFDSPRDLLTVASLVQAEGKYRRDFRMISRVVYNRLDASNSETNGYLDFDSTYNYAKGQSTLDVPPVSELRLFEDPYNTYAVKGLPPGPIGNPGSEALAAAIDPAKGDWYYFVSISEDETRFAETYEEHQKNVEEYNKLRRD
jgi:UPF0755 protein